MKTMKFDYTDSKGKKSYRKLAVLSMPSDKVYGIDYTELSTEVTEYFLQDLMDLKEQHKKELEVLMAEHDLKHKLRQFFPVAMENLEVID